MGSVGRARTASSTVATLELPVEEETGDDFIDRVEYDRDREYTKFPDEAAYSHAYKGDGEEQVKFFKENSNYDELIGGLNSDERDAFRHWTRGDFMDGQQYGGFSNMDASRQEWTRIYDKILDQATLDKSVVVTRLATAELVLGKGHKRATLDELKAARGQLVTSKGSMSTGAAKEGLTIGSSKQIEYVIHIAGGTKGAGMWVGDSRINGWGPDQREFMTNRDSVYAVGRTYEDKKRHVYRVNLYYVGREKHDYS